MRHTGRNGNWKRAIGWALIALAFQIGTALAAPAADLEIRDNRSSAWLGADKQPLPFETEEAVLEFLENARVISLKRIGKGINNPRKLLLELNGVKAHAVFRDVRVEQFKKIDRNRHDLFRDDALFEVAAYRLSRLLGMDCIPPTVERQLYGKRGSLQLWVERAITETKRLEKDLDPPDRRRWQFQLHVMRVFDNLIHNDDRNQGNILFDRSWKLWMIDHTRAFRREKSLSPTDVVWFCHSLVWERLKSVDDETIREQLEPYLYPKELQGLLTRRQLLVSRIESLIEQRGERLVLFDLDPKPVASDSNQVALNQ